MINILIAVILIYSVILIIAVKSWFEYDDIVKKLIAMGYTKSEIDEIDAFCSLQDKRLVDYVIDHNLQVEYLLKKIELLELKNK